MRHWAVWLVLLPYVLIEAGGYSPFAAGMAPLPFPPVIGSASRLMGWIAGATGRARPLTVGSLVTGLGFALLVRASCLRPAIGPALCRRYWWIACGIARRRRSVDHRRAFSVGRSPRRHRVGVSTAPSPAPADLIATALAGGVIAQSGPALVAAFHAAALIGAGLALAAGTVAFATLKGIQPRT